MEGHMIQGTMMDATMMLYMIAAMCAYRQRKASAQISREAAELLKGYRQCIQKHEGDLTKAKESCALYREGLERIELSRMSCSCM